MLFLIVSVAASAVTFYNDDRYVLGDLESNVSVVCERCQRTGFVQLEKERPCCIDADDNGYCGNDELRLGAGRKVGLHMTYWWPTHSFTPSFSHKLMALPCDGTTIITGPEYHDFLTARNCSHTAEIVYCCPDGIFPQVIKPKITGSAYRAPPSDDTMIMVVNENRWNLVKAGRYADKFIEKAIRTENERCSTGGGEIFRWEQDLGSIFSDINNYHEGERIFMFIKPDYDIVPLVTWC